MTELKDNQADVLYTEKIQQQILTLCESPELKVSGTSNLHDWETISTKASGTLTAMINEGEIVEIVSLSVKMPSESLIHEKEGMNKMVYETLKTNEHEKVNFELVNATKINDKWSFNGKFTVVGISQDATFDVTINKTPSSEYKIEGSYSPKLTDFGIEPPTAMMGQVKAGNKVTITFNVKFK